MPTYATSTVAAPMPNLENLRKQAKLVLHWHRDRYYPVAAQIRSGLPRFSQMTDPEILAAQFSSLSDAQELVARQHGFESWQALKTGLSTMRTMQTRPRPPGVITAAEPELFVADITASCDFFTGKLGFTVVLRTASRPSMAGDARRRRLNLRCVEAPPIDRRAARSRRLLAASLTVDTAGRNQAAVPRVSGSGRNSLPDVEEGAVGRAQFHLVKDPDGNLLLFAGPAE